MTRTVHPMTRAGRWLASAALAGALACGGETGGGTIRVELLHSLTGPMATSERAVVDATQLAIDEINERGGVLGRRVEAVVADGASDQQTFAREAERLITEEDVVTVFGCWTSACRRTVRPVFETHDHLLFYPLQYEGLEQSPNIVYLGAASNQQIFPALKWTLRNRRRRIFLVGSDYVFPRTANEILKEQAARWRGEIVGEEYLLLGGVDVDRVVDAIVEAEPDIILNTINGRETNRAFFRALRAAGITSDGTPTVSFSLSEIELSPDAHDMEGDYVAWNYFQSIDSQTNERFVERFQETYGEERAIGDPMEAAYVGVHLWAIGVEAGTVDRAGGHPDPRRRQELQRTGRHGVRRRRDATHVEDGPNRADPYRRSDRRDLDLRNPGAASALSAVPGRGGLGRVPEAALRRLGRTVGESWSVGRRHGTREGTTFMPRPGGQRPERDRAPVQIAGRRLKAR